MRSLRKAAKDQPCTMCGADDGTSVLHHVRVGNVGMGTKPPDWLGMVLCAGCHRYVHHEGIADHKTQLLAYQRQITRWLADGRVALSQGLAEACARAPHRLTAWES